jgi:hypothetical protein
LYEYMTSKARGMPDMTISAKGQEKLEKETKTEAEIFSKNEVSFNPTLDIKPIEARPTTNAILDINNDRPTTNADLDPSPIIKPKRKMTIKQAEGLKKGREKSLEIRRANKKVKMKPPIKEAPTQVDNFIPTPLPQQTPQQYSYPHQQMPTPVYIAPPNNAIDYDRIMDGVASRWRAHSKGQQEERNRLPVIPEFNKEEFERGVRLDEKNKILAEIEELQKAATQRKNLKTTESVLQAPSNYGYAFEMNSRKRYNRY